MDLATVGPRHHRYKNPPIVEAIVELLFPASELWDEASPAKLYERLRDEYPERPGTRKRLEALFSAESLEIGEPVSVSQQDDRVVYKADTKLLMFGAGAVSVHSLRPYEGWEAWFQRTQKAVDILVSELEPQVITQVGLRYINHVLIPSESFSLTDYFTITQGLPAGGFPDRMSGFFDRMQLAYDDDTEITFTWATIQPPQSDEDKAAFLVDLDLKSTGEFEPQEALSRLQLLHDRENIAFESLINDRLRGVFNAD